MRTDLFHHDTRTPRAREHYQTRLKELNEAHQLISTLQDNFPTVDRLTVLSIGCGEHPFEYEALSELLQIDYVGIDPDEAAIKKLNRQHARNTNARFFAINGMNLERILKLFNENPIHILIFRHPVIHELPLTKDISSQFKMIFSRTAPAIVASGGLLLGSCFYPEERDEFHSLMQLITDVNPIALPESTQAFWDIEFMPTGLGLFPRQLYADRFFVAYPNFELNWAATIEKEDGLFESSAEYINEMTRALKNAINKDNSHEHINHVLKLIIREAALKASSSITEETLLRQIISRIETISVDDVCDMPNLPTWCIQRHHPNTEDYSIILRRICVAIIKTAQKLAHYPIKTIELACRQAVALVEKRPLPSQLPQPKEEKKSAKTPSPAL